MLRSLEVIDVSLVCGKFAAKLPIIFQLLQGQRGTFLHIFGQKFAAFIFMKNLLLMFISYYSLGGNIIGYICSIFVATFTKIFRNLGKLFLENISLWEQVVVLKGPNIVFWTLLQNFSPRILWANWMSLGIMVTLLAWKQQRLESSNRPTK